MKSCFLSFFKFLVSIIFLFLILPAFSQKPKPKPKPAKKKIDTTAVSIKKAQVDTDTVLLAPRADSIVAFAKKFIGIRYCYGGEDTKGFDCAGFVCFVYRNFKIKLPRTADAQALLGKEVNRKTMRPGDLVYFKGSNKKNKAVGHSGIVVENKNGKIKFISATVNAGIHIDDIDGPYWKERYLFAKRILISTK